MKWIDDGDEKRRMLGSILNVDGFIGDDGTRNPFAGGEMVKDRERLLEEIFESALQNDMNFFG